VIRQRSQIAYSILVLLIIATLSCTIPQAISSTPASPTPTPADTLVSRLTPMSHSPTPVASSTAHPTAPPPVADHRISTHRIYGLAEFYDKLNAQNFVPRGVNYFVLVPVQDHYEDRLFADDVYDHSRTRADFAALSAAGYNTVRIILDGCTSGDTCIGVNDGQGLNPAYLDNVTDLISLAKEANLFLLFASKDLPDLGGYAALANKYSNASFAPGRNTEFLTSGGIRATQQYWADILAGLAMRKAPFDVILGWELLDEQYYFSDQPPFSLTTKRITTANGKTYAISDPKQVQAMAVDGMRYYIDQLRKTIVTYDPTALITMGFFAPDEPNPWREGDNRYVETAGLLSDSALDFFDLHTDPAGELALPELVQNFGLDEHVSKPVIMGAAGASTWAYPQVSDGAIAIQDWIASSCSQGFSGWAYYGYFPFPAGLADATWGFVDSQNYLMKALAPITQPDACTTTALPGRNLGLNKPVKVSQALPDQTAQMAVDGDTNTQWSSGAFPTQWIEIDLGALYSIGEIRLTVGQWPAGETIHEIWVGSSQADLKKVYDFKGSEFDFDVLNYVPATPLQGIRYARIVTTESPSWVSWREIEVLAPFPATPTPTAEITATP
jgi:F5/8 type C domain